MKSYAEFGTDQLVLETYFNNHKTGVMVEVGSAGDTLLSTSKLFREAGWRTICVEPNPEFARQQREVGVEVYEVALADVENPARDFFVVKQPPGHALTAESGSSLDLRQKVCGKTQPPIKVRVTTLNTLLQEIHVNALDFLCIDTEGWELEVMRGFDTDRYRPKVIVLENFKNDPAYPAYMLTVGYEKAMAAGYNEIYLRK